MGIIRIRRIRWKQCATRAQVIEAEVAIEKMGLTSSTIPKVFADDTWTTNVRDPKGKRESPMLAKL